MTVGGVVFAVGLIFEVVAEYRNKEKAPAVTKNGGEGDAPPDGQEKSDDQKF